MKRVTKEEVIEWKRLYEDKGLSIPAIAKKASRNHHVVYYNLLRAGASIRSGQIGEGVTSIEIDAWTQRFLVGEAPEEFSLNQEFLRTPQTIYRHLAPRLRSMFLELAEREVIENDES